MDALSIREMVKQALAGDGAEVARAHPNDFPGDEFDSKLTIRTPDGRIYEIKIGEI